MESFESSALAATGATTANAINTRRSKGSDDSPGGRAREKDDIGASYAIAPAPSVR
jgi:hypothetical protein